MSHSLTCPFSCPPACRIPSSSVVLRRCCRRRLHLRPLSPDVLNYFIRYYSPPTTTSTVLTPSGTRAHSTPFRSAILPAGLKRTVSDTFCTFGLPRASSVRLGLAESCYPGLTGPNSQRNRFHHVGCLWFDEQETHLIMSECWFLN